MTRDQQRRRKGEAGGQAEQETAHDVAMNAWVCGSACECCSKLMQHVAGKPGAISTRLYVSINANVRTPIERIEGWSQGFVLAGQRSGSGQWARIVGLEGSRSVGAAMLAAWPG
jgi:hypothetical protein